MAAKEHSKDCKTMILHNENLLKEKDSFMKDAMRQSKAALETINGELNKVVFELRTVLHDLYESKPLDSEIWSSQESLDTTIVELGIVRKDVEKYMRNFDISFQVINQ